MSKTFKQQLFPLKLFFAGSEFVSASHLVCHRLISSWKTDLNSSLAALELLQGLARTKLLEKGKNKNKNFFRKDLHRSLGLHRHQTSVLHFPSFSFDLL